MEKKSVLLVDDHPIVRKGLSNIVRTAGYFEVCGEAANAREALSLARTHSPHGIIMDISMPGCNGIELIKMLIAEDPGCRVLVLSMHSQPVYAIRALKAGARGYLLKGEPPGEIIQALRRILRGELALSSSIGGRLIFQAIQSMEAGKEVLIERLTRREREIFDLFGKGYCGQQVADELGLSIKTVDTHRMHAKEKLFCSTAEELIEFAREWQAYLDNESQTEPLLN